MHIYYAKNMFVRRSAIFEPYSKYFRKEEKFKHYLVPHCLEISNAVVFTWVIITRELKNLRQIRYVDSFHVSH
jgi:hypothetical protein